MISCGLCSVLTPELLIPDTPELKSAIERSLQSEYAYKKKAALYLGILTHQLTGQDVCKHLKQFSKLSRATRFLRELGYVDEYRNILDENGNVIEETPE